MDERLVEERKWKKIKNNPFAKIGLAQAEGEMRDDRRGDDG